MPASQLLKNPIPREGIETDVLCLNTSPALRLKNPIPREGIETVKLIIFVFIFLLKNPIPREGIETLSPTPWYPNSIIKEPYSPRGDWNDLSFDKKWFMG